MSSELRWAVTDGPAGTAAVALPEDGTAARLLGLHRGSGFWCSRAAGGCGGRLVLEARDGARPHFRHSGDVRCALTGSGAAPAYEHLRHRRAVGAWLAAQGLRPRLEEVRGPSGSGGLHVVVAEVSCAVAVQLSPLPDTAWRERDDRYRRQVRHVTWLYGSAAESAADTELAVRGVAYAVRRHNTGLLVGVRDVDGGTRWVRLGSCRLTADGFAAPGAAEARALHARRAADRQEAARRAARCAERAARGPRDHPRVEALPFLPFPA
ncbi:competence protein CoiA family protein [Geodermatophilus sp. URMC 61]|uniref:competence protein CoiA family protein n=1 Tax=Geodermatophilus sp. URMC 61 TaxID=3423411 RepID=UPI00406CF000